MKTLALCTLLSLSSSLFAQPLEVEMTGFNFTYQAPHGSGQAESFFRNMWSSERAVEVIVEKIDQALQVSVSGQENHSFEIENAPALVQEADSMLIEDMNLSFRNSLSLRLTTGEFRSSKNATILKDFQLDCQRERALPELMDQVLSGCVKQMDVSSSSFNSEETKRLLSLVLDPGLRGSDISVRKLDFKSRQGSFTFSASVKAQISGTVRSKGNLSYNPSSGVLTLKINEVKFGILSIRRMVFDELKKQQGEGFEVSEPYVYLTMKKSAPVPSR